MMTQMKMMDSMLLCGLMLMSYMLLGQQEATPSQAYADTDIAKMRDANLVIVLKTNSESYRLHKAAAIKAGRMRTLEHLARDSSLRSAFHLNLMLSMSMHFKYARPYFMYDYDLKKHLAGEEGLFLNGQLSYDASITLDPGQHTYYAKEGITGEADKNPIASYFIYDPHEPQHRYGMPSIAVDLVGPKVLFSGISGASTYRNGSKIAKIWNRRFYQMARKTRSDMSRQK